MFEHSVKVPRHYKLAANIVKKVSTEGGSVKTLLYDNKLRHFRTNVLYALITETIKHSAYIDKLFEHSELFSNEPRLDPWLAKVLTAELLFGKKSLPGQSKPEQTVSSYREQFEKYCNENQDETTKEVVPRPRYVRINTNLLTTSDAIRAFQDEGYHFIRCTSGSYNDYLAQIQKLTEYDFTQDYHVKTVYVFPPGTKFHDHELYLEGKIVLQDKATALAVHLLAAAAGGVALDLCAAPGMKATQLAAHMRNQGTIYALERDERRYATLCAAVERAGATCVRPELRDSLAVRRGEYEDAEYILLDPSCSGSGMELSVHSYIDPARLAKLTSLQEKFLKHAMNSFPKARRIVYSTCSLFPEENERVVTNTVRVSRAKWRVQDVKELLKGNWNNFGSNMYGSIGERCLYARPDSDLTTGFFLAVLDRDPKDFEKQVEKDKASDAVENEEVKDKSNNDVGSGVDIEETVADDVEAEKPKKKKKKASKENTNHDEVIDEVGDVTVLEHDVPKRKKKKKSKENTQNDNESDLENNDVMKERTEKRKTDDEKMTDSVEPSERIQDSEPVEKVKKKKKDKRKHLDADTEIVGSDQMLETNEVPKKKKKNKT